MCPERIIIELGLKCKRISEIAVKIGVRIREIDHVTGKARY